MWANNLKTLPMSAALKRERRKRILRPILNQCKDGKVMAPPRHRPPIIRQTPPHKPPRHLLGLPDLLAPIHKRIPAWISFNFLTLSVPQRMELQDKNKRRRPIKRAAGVKLLNLGGSPRMRSCAVGVLDSSLLFRPNAVEPGFVTKGSTSPSFSHVVLRNHSLSIYSRIVTNYLILHGILPEFRDLVDEALFPNPKGGKSNNRMCERIKITSLRFVVPSFGSSQSQSRKQR